LLDVLSIPMSCADERQRGERRGSAHSHRHAMGATHIEARQIDSNRKRSSWKNHGMSTHRCQPDREYSSSTAYDKQANQTIEYVSRHGRKRARVFAAWGCRCSRCGHNLGKHDVIVPRGIRMAVRRASDYPLIHSWAFEEVRIRYHRNVVPTARSSQFGLCS
jgi:hypothetical protein